MCVRVRYSLMAGVDAGLEYRQVRLVHVTNLVVVAVAVDDNDPEEMLQTSDLLTQMKFNEGGQLVTDRPEQHECWFLGRRATRRNRVPCYGRHRIEILLRPEP